MKPYLPQHEPNPSDRFVVRHFNKASKQFDGPLETIRILQAQPHKQGVPRSTNREIEKPERFVNLRFSFEQIRCVMASDCSSQSR